MMPIATLSPATANRSRRWLTADNDAAWPIQLLAARHEPRSLAKSCSMSPFGPVITSRRPARPITSALDRPPLCRQRRPNPHSAS